MCVGEGLNPINPSLSIQNPRLHSIVRTRELIDAKKSKLKSQTYRENMKHEKDDLNDDSYTPTQKKSQEGEF